MTDETFFHGCFYFQIEFYNNQLSSKKLPSNNRQRKVRVVFFHLIKRAIYPRHGYLCFISRNLISDAFST